MAISGSGGWIPSQVFTIRHRSLVSVGYAHNRPRSVTHRDMGAAVEALVAQPESLVCVSLVGHAHRRLYDYLIDLDLIDKLPGHTPTWTLDNPHPDDFAPPSAGTQEDD